MKYTDNALNIMTVKSYKGIGNAWIIKHLTGNESTETIVSILNKSLKGENTDVFSFESLKNRFKNYLTERMEDCCDGVVAIGDDNFPSYNNNVKDSEKPVFFFYKGDLELLRPNNKNISVIGLLNPTEEIIEREKRFVAELIKNGATIVSGLALGCDSVSHIEAMNSNGKTIAILPSPLTSILPASNKKLAYQIVEEGGLLITEYGTDFKSKYELSSRYKERDRLQALFCNTIILTASYSVDSAKKWNISNEKLDCGSRLALGYAKEYNTPIAVMYDENTDTTNPMFDLNRDFIKNEKNITILNDSNYKDKIKEIIRRQKNIGNIIQSELQIF